MQYRNDDQLTSLLLNPRTRKEAFAQIVSTYSEQLYKQIRRIVLNHSDADDVLQEVFIKAWKGIDAFRGEAKIYTWLYRIAYFEAITYLRSHKRKQQNNVELTEETQHILDNMVADPYFDGDEVEIQFQKAIAELPPKQHQVFLLRYYDELPYQQISEMTGTSEGALKASYHHAVKYIKKKLIGEE